MTSVLKTINGFCTSNKNNNVKALSMIALAIDYAIEHGNTDPLGVLISKTDSKMSPVIRKIVGAVTGGLQCKKDTSLKPHYTGLKWTMGDNWGPSEKMAVLRQLIEDKASIYGKDVKEQLLPAVIKEPTVKTLEQVEEHIRAYAAKQGFDIKLVKMVKTPDEPAH